MSWQDPRLALQDCGFLATSNILMNHNVERDMTRFRPCIDLHAGSVKQIVGGTLSTNDDELRTNFTSQHPSAYYADLYKRHDLRGGHVIMLGPNNDDAAGKALAAWPGRLQIGGGIKDSNAKSWIDAGAEKVLSMIYAEYEAMC